MKLVFDKESYTKEDYFWMIYNKLGCKDLALQCSFTDPSGDVFFSKRLRYDELMNYDQDEYIPHVKMTRKRFVANATHRTILDIEIMFDIDDVYDLKEFFEYEVFDGTDLVCTDIKVPKFESIKDKSEWIYRELTALGFEACVHWTQNKSYHISVLVPSFRTMDKKYRRYVKRSVLWRYGADMMKDVESQLIAIEGCPHYRSSKEKIQVFFDGSKEH